MKGRALLVAGSAAALVIALGPRAEVGDFSETIPSVGNAGEVADLIRSRESRQPGLRMGAEAQVVWAQHPGQRTDRVLVYLHGFSASGAVSCRLAELVASRLGANLLNTRLTGHGMNGAALGRARAADWLQDGLQAWGYARGLGDQVILLGVSTGATLATWLAARRDVNPAAVVMVSPNFAPADRTARALLWPWARHWVPLVVGRERSWDPKNPRHGAFWTTRYPVDALFEMMALVALVDGLDLSKITAPVYGLYSREDTVVSPNATEVAFERFTAAKPRRLQELTAPEDTHVLAGDILSPTKTVAVASHILAFLADAGIEETRGR